jgi:hypothetical protein
VFLKLVTIEAPTPNSYPKFPEILRLIAHFGDRIKFPFGLDVEA